MYKDVGFEPYKFIISMERFSISIKFWPRMIKKNSLLNENFIGNRSSPYEGDISDYLVKYAWSEMFPEY